MSSTKIQQTQNVGDPSLKDVLDLFKKDIFTSLNAHHIGTVESFNSSKQTASATINYKKTFFELDAVTGLYNPVLVDYPLLMDCPVIVLGGGSAALTFPIQQGDECLVLFNDRSIDNWLESGGGAGVSSPRAHSFADGIILVGLRNSTRSLANYDTSHAAIVSGTGSVGVNVATSKVYIANSGVTLGVALRAFCTACASSSDTTLVTAAATLLTALGGILE